VVVGEIGGYVDVRSTPGEGSTFEILLPRVESETRSVSGAGEPP
jgi:signal transduction histidine kinase